MTFDDETYWPDDTDRGAYSNDDDLDNYEFEEVEDESDVELLDDDWDDEDDWEDDEDDWEDDDRFDEEFE